MNDVTPRQLWDAAVAARLAMPGLTQFSRGGVSPGRLVTRDGKTFGDGAASLADVIVAVEDALAERGVYPVWVHTVVDGEDAQLTRLPLRWNYMTTMADLRLKRHHIEAPTRAACLMAACAALAKEAK